MSSELFAIFNEELQEISKREHRNRKFTEKYREDEKFRNGLKQAQIRYYERQRDYDRQKNYVLLKLIEKFGNEELQEIVAEINKLDENKVYE